MAKVLLIDNDLQQCIHYRKELQGKDLEVEFATSFQEGRRRVREGGFDLVVLELQVPGGNGLQMLTTLLEEDETLSMVIHTSSGAYKDNFVSWLAEAYLIKPCDPRELRRIIREVLERKSREVHEEDASGAARGSRGNLSHP